MMNAEIVIGCFILLASLTTLSGLCSLCLEESCHDNGECKIGCVPGYVGEYCDEKCPSMCLNKVCHRNRKDGTVKCTDGCKAGFCSIQCELKCPGDCVTCDRQCDSCNVTLCPERRYGVNCSRTCKPRHGICDRETGECIQCRRKYYGDKCNQKCTSCFSRALTIRDKCLAGCDNCQSKETCSPGFHGDSCEIKCPSGCDKPGRCNRATGECDTGCVSGYYGLTCNDTCRGHCLSEKCDRGTGKCSAGCMSGYHGPTCNSTCNRFCVGGICNQRNGICTSGCESGYISNLDMCEKNSNEESTMDNNLLLHSVLVFISAVLAIGIAVVIYILCKRQKKQKKEHVQNGTNHTEDSKEPLLKYGRDTDTVQMITDTAGQSRNTQSIQLLPSEVERIRARTTNEIEVYTAGMVRVSALNTVLAKFEAGQRWITITGNAGDGKTTLGYLVLKEFLETTINVFIIDKPEEYYQIANIKGDRIIMFDDRFGAFIADEHLIKGWLDVIRKLLGFVENDIRVIFVSRKNVVNESMMYLGQFTDKLFAPTCVVDLGKLKVIEERMNILDYHLQHEHLSECPELIRKVCNKDIAHGFPHCCKMYAKLRSNGLDVNIEDFFESPLKFLDMTSNVLYRDNCKELFQLMIENDGTFDVYNVEDKDKRQELLRVEKEQEGSYITVWRNGICQFAHPSVYESVLNVINENDPLYCVQYATLSVIRQKMIISTSDEEDQNISPCYIIVKPIPAVLNGLAERFREDILKGDYSVFKHRLCQSKEFCEALISCCVETALKQSGSKQFINQRGEDGDTMLWTALKSEQMIAVQALVKSRADVNIRDDRGRTPLHYLFQLNTLATGDDYDDGDDKHIMIKDITKLIISEERVDVNICDQYGQTPLHYLCQLKLSLALNDENQDRLGMDTIRLVITEGRGDINISDQYGHTPLHYLFKCNTVATDEIRWILMEAKGNLNLCEQNNSTPLHHLCANSDLQLATLDLVNTEGKGDFNKGDEHGTTPLHFLCKNEHFELEVVHRIFNMAKGDINKQDNNGITPLHVLCKVSLQLESILTLINQGNKRDRHGNTPLHFICRRKGLNAGVLQQLKQMPETYMNKGNLLGYTPLDYFTDKDGSLPWTDGMICRSVADLVVCRFQQDDTWTAVLGPTMTFSSERVHDLISVEDFGRQLTNTKTCRKRGGSGQVWLQDTRSSTPALLQPSSYWEINSRLAFTEEKWNILLQMGLVEADGNLDKERCTSTLCRSVFVSVTSKCILHKSELCIQVFRRDQDMQYQIGECVTRSRPEVSETITFTFGLALDLSRGKVAFIDVEKRRLLGKIDVNFTQEVVPTFYMPSLNETFETKLRLISGREIFVDNRKRQLIEHALST